LLSADPKWERIGEARLSYYATVATGKVRRSQTDVLPQCHATNLFMYTERVT